MQKIILIGYMAVGKTTIAQLLAEKTGFKTEDIDRLIEKKIGLTVSEIFQQKGEIFFRKIEHEIIKEIIENDEDLVISTGGGTPCYANNHLLLNGENIVSIYLMASLDVILKRLKYLQSFSLKNEFKAVSPLSKNHNSFQRVDHVSKKLQYSIKGDLITIWPVGYQHPDLHDR